MHVFSDVVHQICNILSDLLAFLQSVVHLLTRFCVSFYTIFLSTFS